MKKTGVTLILAGLGCFFLSILHFDFMYWIHIGDDNLGWMMGSSLVLMGILVVLFGDELKMNSRG